MIRAAAGLAIVLTQAAALPVPPPVPPVLLQAGAALTIRFAKGDAWKPAPYTRFRNEILIDATIDGHPATVMIDNGAQVTLVDSGFARDAGIALGPAGGAMVAGRGRLETQRTAPATLAITHMMSVEGPLVATDLAPLSRALGRRVDAVLGADVLDHVAVMVRPDTNRLAILNSGGITAGAGATRIALRDGNRVDASVGGHALRLQVDFGFNGTVRLTDAAWARVFPTGSAVTQGTQTNADGATRATRAGRADLTLDGIRLSDAPIDSGFENGARADGLLGNGLFARWITILDVPGGELVLVPLPSATQGT